MPCSPCRAPLTRHASLTLPWGLYFNAGVEALDLPRGPWGSGPDLKDVAGSRLQVGDGDRRCPRLHRGVNVLTLALRRDGEVRPRPRARPMLLGEGLENGEGRWESALRRTWAAWKNLTPVLLGDSTGLFHRSPNPSLPRGPTPHSASTAPPQSKRNFREGARSSFSRVIG